MKPLGVIHLYRVRLRSRLIQEALAAIGIAVGVALLFASQVANTSLNGSVEQLTSALVGRSRLQLEARSPLGFEERLLGKVQRLPGVRSAAAVLEEQVNVVGPDGSKSVELIGADPGFVGLGGSLLKDFRAVTLARQRALALPLPIAKQIGVSSLQVVKLQFAARMIRALLGVTLEAGEVGALADSPVALAPLAYAQHITGMTGRVSRIFVRPEAGQERQVKTALVALAAGHLNVEPATYDARLFANAAAPTNESTTLFAVISALVGFLFAFNAMLLTVPARRALIADLQLDGYDPRSLAEVLLFDSFVLGVLASLAGLALGDLLSARVFNASPGFLSFAFPVGSQRIVTWQSVAVAVAGGMLAAAAGVMLPLRDVVTQMSDADTGSRTRWRRSRRPVMPLVGLACLAVTVLVVTMAPAAAVVGVAALTIALLSLLPSLLRSVLGLVEWLTLDLKATAPFVAVRELRSAPGWSRTVAIAATGAVAVFGSVAIDGTRMDLQRGLDASARAIDSTADVWVTPTAESDAFATVPFSDESGRLLESLSGVREVRPYRGDFLDYGVRRVWVLAPSPAVHRPIAPAELVEGNLALVTARIRAGGWVVVSRALASEHHLRIGQAFTLPSPEPTTVRLAGVISNLGWPSGAMILNADEFARAWGSADVSAFQVILSTRSSSIAVDRLIGKSLGPNTGLTAESAFQREQRHYREASQGLSRLTAITALVLIASILAMAAAMGSMVWQRRARLARLKLDGLSDLAIWRALLLESVILLGSGCAIGAVFGLCGQVVGSRAILRVTGFPVIFSLAVPLALGSFVFASVLAVAIAAVPGYFLARGPATGLSD
ncbi:MAG TPA: FtsX-like permease family protein [Solirubrobacteraceae bacterium]|nr:FtsX-like permease family protein [Solirubrobacteraceae bacterium]